MTSLVPDDVPVLTDGVVTLRAHRPDDVDAVLEQCADPVSQRWTTVPVPYPRERRRRLRHRPWSPRPGRRAAGSSRSRPPTTTARRGSAAPSSSATRATGGPRSPTARTRGPGAAGSCTAPCGCCWTGGSSEQRLRTVIWWANRGNWASRRTAWRLGFSCDGTVAALAAAARRAARRLGRRAARRRRADPAERLAGRAAGRAASTWCSRPSATTTPTGSWRPAATSAPPTGSARMPSPYTLDDARRLPPRPWRALATGRAVTWAVADPGTDELARLRSTLSASSRARGARSATGRTRTPAAGA